MAKRAGRHPEKALTAVQIRNLKLPGRYADGNGLYLVVDESGARRWLLRITIQGHRRDIGLGGASLVSLAEAREKALEYRKLAREGGDPLAERRKVRKITPTFAEAVELVHAEHASTWKNAKHAQQWRNTLQQYACPFIGEKPVDRIDTPDVLLVLSPIWLTKQETARRVRQRIGTVLDWAKAAGHRDTENPINGVAKGLPKQGDRKSHHSALPYQDVPEFVARLRSSGDAELSQLAFEFLILTAARTSEVLGARWDEVDRGAALWTVPGKRMKAGRVHRVPLSARSLHILERAAAIGMESEFIFPGRSGEKPLSNMVFLMALRRMKVPITAHGFRSSFRDWAAETTSFPQELAEMALAHEITNRVEAAYRRGDLLEKRRAMMTQWSSYVSTGDT